MTNFNETLDESGSQLELLSFSGGAVTGTYQIQSVSGTAVSGVDFQPLSLNGTITDNLIKFGLNGIDDSIFEGDEFFTVNVTGTYTVNGGTTVHSFSDLITVRIVDDDPPPDPYQEALNLTREELLDWAMTRAEAKPENETDEELLLYAINEILKVRDRDSTNTSARDAEYYLIGAYAGATGNPVYAGAVLLVTPAYSAAKTVAGLLGVQGLLQANPDKLTSPPGGTVSAYQGLIDGYGLLVDNHLQIFHRMNQIAPLSISATPDESFDYASKLNLHPDQHTIIDLFKSSEVPMDAASRIILDQDYAHPLILGTGNNFVVGGDGANWITASGGNNNLFGLAGNDQLIAGSGMDILDGGSGYDILDAGGGKDLLVGDIGKDTMTGGDDADIFDFNLKTETIKGANRDVIMDFSGVGGELDLIDLAGIDAKKGAGNQVFKFIGGAKFHHKAGELQVKYNAVTDVATVSGDIDGNGKADFQIEVHSASALQKLDFVL